MCTLSPDYSGESCCCSITAAALAPVVVTASHPVMFAASDTSEDFTCLPALDGKPHTIIMSGGPGSCPLSVTKTVAATRMFTTTR